MEQTKKKDTNKQLVIAVLVIVLIGTLLITTSIVVYNTTRLPNFIKTENVVHSGTATVVLNIKKPSTEPPAP